MMKKVYGDDCLSRSRVLLVRKTSLGNADVDAIQKASTAILNAIPKRYLVLFSFTARLGFN